MDRFLFGPSAGAFLETGSDGPYLYRLTRICGKKPLTKPRRAEKDSCVRSRRHPQIGFQATIDLALSGGLPLWLSKPQELESVCTFVHLGRRPTCRDSTAGQVATQAGLVLAGNPFSQPDMWIQLPPEQVPFWWVWEVRLRLLGYLARKDWLGAPGAGNLVGIHMIGFIGTKLFQA